ncbi:hypothetical protein A8C56_05255 [Niabella ginsenosidivorans]|uniref:Uncharacterized protein n=1 Tax=Niabella ginsenosidivorans TaxID=1176587 RepID=A0A1A9HYM4_9BACT|nr:hypothetical protein A8C56_05255 [Niabella ginsenosidivorans]
MGRSDLSDTAGNNLKGLTPAYVGLSSITIHLPDIAVRGKTKKFIKTFTHKQTSEPGYYQAGTAFPFKKNYALSK